MAGVAVLTLAGCQSADNKIPQIAADFCDCFTDIEKNMSSQTKSIMHKAALSSDPQSSIAAEVAKMTDEEKVAIQTEMGALSDMQDKNSTVGRCMEDVTQKYDKARTINEKKFMQKLIKELDSKPGCRFTADLMQMGLKAQGGGD